MIHIVLSSYTHVFIDDVCIDDVMLSRHWYSRLLRASRVTESHIHVMHSECTHLNHINRFIIIPCDSFLAMRLTLYEHLYATHKCVLNCDVFMYSYYVVRSRQSWCEYITLCWQHDAFSSTTYTMWRRQLKSVESEYVQDDQLSVILTYIMWCMRFMIVIQLR